MAGDPFNLQRFVEAQAGGRSISAMRWRSGVAMPAGVADPAIIILRLDRAMRPVRKGLTRVT